MTRQVFHLPSGNWQVTETYPMGSSRTVEAPTLRRCFLMLGYSEAQATQLANDYD